MGGIEKLVDFILDWIRVLRFWIIVDENQHGIVLRFGRWQRVDPEKLEERWPRLPAGLRVFLARLANGYSLGPGLYLKLFAWDEEFVIDFATETTNLKVQTLTSKNGKKLQISGVFKWEIADPYKYFLEIGDEAGFLDDLFYGAIADEVMAAEWPFDAQEMKKRILEVIRKEARQYGFRIRSFKFNNLVESNAMRVFL